MKNPGGYIWNFINRFGGQVLWLVSTMILARFLTPEDFGTIGVLSIIFVVASTLTESGLGGALVIQKELKEDDCSTIFTFNFVVSIVSFLLVFVSADLVESFYNKPNLSLVTRCLSFVFIVNGFAVVPRTILFYNLKFKELCIINLVATFISLIITIIMAVFKMGVYSLVAYQILTATISTLGFIILSKYHFHFGFYPQSFKKLFSFGAFTTLASVVDSVYQNMLAALLGKFFNISQAGFFSQAKKIEDATSQTIIGTVSSTSFPILAKLTSNREAFKNEAESLLRNIPLLIFPLLVLISIYSKEVVLILYGKEWVGASWYLSLLMISGIFVIYEALLSNYVKSLGCVKQLFTYTIIKRVLALLILFICVFYSVKLAIYGYVCNSIIGCLITCSLYGSIIGEGFSTFIRIILKGLMFIVLFYLPVYFSYAFFSNIIISLFLTLLFVLLYYFLLLPIAGINTRLLFLQLLKRIR